MNISNDIRRYRMLKNLSLRQLAKDSGINHSYIALLESGKKTNPTLETLLKLCNSLGLSIEIVEAHK